MVGMLRIYDAGTHSNDNIQNLKHTLGLYIQSRMAEPHSRIVNIVILSQFNKSRERLPSCTTKRK